MYNVMPIAPYSMATASELFSSVHCLIVGVGRKREGGRRESGKRTEGGREQEKGRRREGERGRREAEERREEGVRGVSD